HRPLLPYRAPLPFPALYPFPTRRSFDLAHVRPPFLLPISQIIAVVDLDLGDPFDVFDPVQAWDDDPEGKAVRRPVRDQKRQMDQDRKSTRLNSSHVSISYAVFCLKKKNA